MMILLATLVLSRPDATNRAFAAEAARLTTATIATFYDPKAKIWKPPVESSEAIGLQGYTFWPSLLAWQDIIEAAKVDKANWKSQIAPYYDALEKYFDKGSHAYCAWTYFPGNDDHFYDDNTWAAVACMEAYEVTGDKRYKARAIDIFDGFVKGGWDSSGNPGGLRWGTKAGLEDRHDRTVSATAAGALAALLIARVDHKAERQEWAKRALDWIHVKLSATNGLIYDGFRSPKFERMNTIWTYNTGVPIRAASEYFRQTKDKAYRDWAVKMGDACLDRTQSPMFDGGVTDLKNRYWWDGVYFVQYLADGMRELSAITHDQKYVNEARREASYCLTYLRDKDGLYWRNMRLWTINEERTAAIYKLTGQSSPVLTADSSERSTSKEDSTKPVEERPMVKTLLANAGAARMFWLLAH